MGIWGLVYSTDGDADCIHRSVIILTLLGALMFGRPIVVQAQTIGTADLEEASGQVGPHLIVTMISRSKSKVARKFA